MAVGGLGSGPYPLRTGRAGVTVEARVDGQRPGQHTCCLPATRRKHRQSDTLWGPTPLCLTSTPGSQAPPAPLLPLPPPSPHAPHLQCLQRSQQDPPWMGTLASALACVQALENPRPCLFKPFGVGLHGNHCTGGLHTDEYIQGSGHGVPGRPWLPAVTSVGVLGTESSGEDTLRPGPFTHTIGSLSPPLYGRQRPRGGGLPARVRRMNVNPRGSGWT